MLSLALRFDTGVERFEPPLLVPLFPRLDEGGRKEREGWQGGVSRSHREFRLIVEVRGTV